LTAVGKKHKAGSLGVGHLPSIRVGMSRTDAGLLAVVVLAGAFYFWTAATSLPFDFASHQTDVYNLLTDSFLHGHTYLPTRPPAGLLALANPYDPIANQPYRVPGVGDMSLYKGHLYAYWGAIPALTLFLPERLLPIGELPQSLALAIYCTLALAFAVLLLRLLVRRLLPAAPAWAVIAGAAGLAFGSAVPFLLRGPNVYEIAIASGACFLAAGLYLLARGSLRPAPRLRTLALGSLSLGFAFNARPPLLLGGGVLLALLILLSRQGAQLGNSRRRLTVVLLGPFAACLLLTGAYNYQRFGSPTQYGIPYQLANTVESRRYPFFSLSYLTPGTYNYLLAPPRFAFAFPYVFLPPPPNYPGHLPARYVLLEPTGGLLPSTPIVLFLAALPWLWRRRGEGCGEHRGELPAIVAGMGLLGGCILLGVAFTVYGTTQRYEVDFEVLLILAAVLSWLALLMKVRARLRRRAAAVAGALALAWGAFCGVAVSFTGYANLLQENHPALFADLEDITSPFATLPTMLLGRPVIARVSSPTPVVLPPVNYLTFAQDHATTELGEGPVTLTILSPGSEDVELSASLCCGSVARGGPLSLVASSSGRVASVVAAPGTVLLPLHLHWGLNRVHVDVAGTHAAGPILTIEHIVLRQR
jgi:hypothetical protein